MNKNITLGIDIGGTKTRIGYLDKNQKINIIGHIATAQNPKEAVKNIVELINSSQIKDKIKNIGVACAGPLSQESGKILSPPNLQQWNDFPIVEILKNQYNTNVRLENDANAAALGEASFGAGRNANTVLYITISTGIGMGIVIDKKIHTGNKGLAGEIWCYPPELFGTRNGLLNITELSSGNGLVQLANDQIKNGVKTILSNKKTSTYEIIEAYNKNDEFAKKLIKNAQITLNATLVFSSCILAPDVIVLGGGLTAQPDIFVHPLKRMFKESMPLHDLKETPMVISELKNDNVICGAMALVK